MEGLLEQKLACSPLVAPQLKGNRLEYRSPCGGDKRRDHQENGVRHNELGHQRARMKSVNLPNTNADLWIFQGYRTLASRLCLLLEQPRNDAVVLPRFSSYPLIITNMSAVSARGAS